MIGLHPQAVWAWSAVRSADKLTIQGLAGEVNRFVISADQAATFVVSDDGSTLVGEVPAGCAAVDDGTGRTGALACTTELTSVQVTAGDGNDSVDSSTQQPRVSVDGGNGEDLLSGGDAADVLSGGEGNDSLDGGGGLDVLRGGDGQDEVDGGSGDDSLDGGSGADRLDGGDGDDALSGGAQSDALSGGSGNDRLAGGDDPDVLLGEDGTDALDGGSGNDSLDGGANDDQLRGGDGDDALDGFEGRDALDGQIGNDTLTAGAAGSTMFGGEGDDILQGAIGNDSLDGSGGDDQLRGDEGPDRLQGGDGNDVLDGGGAADALDGGAGADTVSYELSPAGVAVSLDGRADDGLPGEGDNVQLDVETVVGSGGDDRLSAGPQASTLLAGDGVDVLTGGPAADRLNGGPGDDTLDGGAGADVLEGGDGFDTVAYATRRAGVLVDLSRPERPAGERGEGDHVGIDSETIVGGQGDDELFGAPAVSNVLIGGGGDDRIFESVAGVGVQDEVRCDDGTDRVHVVTGATYAQECENVWLSRQRIRYGSSPAGRPSTYLTGRPLRGGRRRPVSVGLRCQKRTARPCRVTVTLTKRGRRLGRTTISLTPGLTRSVQVRLGRAARQRLRRLRASTLIRVRVDVRSDVGRGTPVIASLPLERVR